MAVGLLTYNCKICAVSATEFVVIEQQQKTNTPYKYRHLDKFHFYAIFIKEEKERYTGFKIVYAMLVDFFFFFFCCQITSGSFLFVFVFWLPCAALQILRFPNQESNSGFCSESTNS